MEPHPGPHTEARHMRHIKHQLTDLEKCELISNVLLIGTENEILLGTFAPHDDVPEGILLFIQVLRAKDFRRGYLRSTLGGMDALTYLEVDPSAGYVLVATQGHFNLLLYRLYRCSTSGVFFLVTLMSLPPYWSTPVEPLGEAKLPIDIPVGFGASVHRNIVHPLPWEGALGAKEKNKDNMDFKSSRIIGLVWSKVLASMTSDDSVVYRVSLVTSNG
eukprot:Blabericola_migrator_1__3386@NODE_1_length_33786_cov_123_788665_g0_i0_p18_GENE_NODE_1_length_33786_cov_123_788665_g0_i0NODE_1_length_33786_cov_123_788665_g0_i0_p18_ORF_typecomplete_len217_score21_37_NODE_1_length_33786_cov_123_788665_g0_i02562026270